MAASSGSLDKGKYLAILMAPDRIMAINGASMVLNWIALLPLMDQRTTEEHVVVH